MRPHSSAPPCGSSAQDATPAYELRAGLRAFAHCDREKRCGVSVVRQEGPGIRALGRPGAWECKWLGVLTCGHIWSCPVCSTKLRMRRLQRVDHAIRAAGGRWQMVTFTVRHHEGMPLRSLFGGVTRAFRRTRQGGAIQRLWTERVTASVRATEVTRGSSGWHPHLHVLLRTDEWTDDDKAALLERWKLMVERELGPACVPNDEHAIQWSKPIDACVASDVVRARYIAGMGLELAGVGKRGRSGSWSSWQIAEAAVSGDERAQTWWREYVQATKGRRALELDDRATRYAKMPLVDELGPVEETEKTEHLISIDALELRALREYEQRFDPGVLGAILDSVKRVNDPKQAVRRWLDLVTTCLGYSSGHVPESNQRPPRGPPD